mmetsp:Transcript_5351/g.16865  ORF Transcript_5351/g.16865 Transcript_5351/m.16865 type:complete len:126 (+) Transcript_5351:75-452(+)
MCLGSEGGSLGDDEASVLEEAFRDVDDAVAALERKSSRSRQEERKQETTMTSSEESRTTGRVQRQRWIFGEKRWMREYTGIVRGVGCTGVSYTLKESASTVKEKGTSRSTGASKVRFTKAVSRAS